MNQLIVVTAAVVVAGLLLVGRMTGAPLRWRDGSAKLPECTSVPTAMAVTRPGLRLGTGADVVDRV
jgi:hypothetical protein